MPTSLLLTLVFIGFIGTNAVYLQRQFDESRNALFGYQQQQLDSLLKLTVVRNQQLLSSIATSSEVQAALVTGDPQQVRESLSDPFWTLNMEAGAHALAVFSAQGEPLAALGEPFRVPELVALVRKDEQPQWQVACHDGACELALVMPLLVDGKTLFIGIGFSLGDVVVQFSQMSGADVAVLTEGAPAEGDASSSLPGWNRGVAAITGRTTNLPLLKSISERHDPAALRASPLILETAGMTYEVRGTPWQDTELLMISDISSDYGEIRQAIRNSIIYGLIGLGLAELLLLWILWKPMTRLRQTADYLPLLAQDRFHEMREALNGLERHRLFDDETEVLFATATQVSTQVEAMQAQLQSRNQELEERGVELQGERDFVHQLLNTIPALILMLDRQGTIILINQYGADMTGYSTVELEGQSIELLTPSVTWNLNLRERFAGLFVGEDVDVAYELEVQCRDNSQRHMSWHNTLIHDRDLGEQVILSVAIDITGRKEAEGKMAWLASHDALTGLYNRRRFTEELNLVVERNRRQDSLSAVMFFDLDQFKDVNDTSGHQTGDLLLKRIAQRLEEVARASDFVARLDGDEFAVIANDIKVDDIATVAERYARALAQVHVEGRGHRHRCTASIGVALIPCHGETVEDLLANADLAMYRAKEAGRNQWQVFDPKEDTTERVRERVYWNEKVDEVLKKRDFQVYFQPIMDMKLGTISHYEALLRVFDGDGQLATGLFIQAAERNGSILVLDELIVERVMEHQAELVRHGIEACISINLSGASFQHPERLLQHVESLLARYDIQPGSLIFEITETAAVKDINVTRQHIDMMRQRGFKFALDDFGVGFSSLFYLKQLPVDYLKIDGSFVRNLPNEPDDQALVQALVQVAKIYRLQTVAEFVENQEIVELLKAYDVDYAQGYHIGKPQAFAEVFFKDRPRLSGHG